VPSVVSPLASKTPAKVIDRRNRQAVYFRNPRSMNRTLCALAFLLLSHAHPLAADTPAKAPNIVFFFTDDQTTNTIGCYGNPIVQTPNIDALAERGVRFENAFASQAICWVSRTGGPLRRVRSIGRNPFFKKLPDGSLRHETDLIVDRGIEFVKQQPNGQALCAESLVQRLPCRGRRPPPRRALRLAAISRRSL
jgi:hypothetical protein